VVNFIRDLIFRDSESITALGNVARTFGLSFLSYVPLRGLFIDR